MLAYLFSNITLLTTGLGWLSQLQQRDPIVYIAAGFFGVMLFVGFIGSMLAIGFAIKKHTHHSSENRTQMYHSEKSDAAKSVIASLRSKSVPDAEIREILVATYHFDTKMAESLLANR